MYYDDLNYAYWVVTNYFPDFGHFCSWFNLKTLYCPKSSDEKGNNEKLNAKRISEVSTT